MLGFTQYGSPLFGIDASSDPTKFQDDWPSGSPLIGAWSLGAIHKGRPHPRGEGGLVKSGHMRTQGGGGVSGTMRTSSKFKFSPKFSEFI